MTYSPTAFGDFVAMRLNERFKDRLIEVIFRIECSSAMFQSGLRRRLCLLARDQPVAPFILCRF